MEKSKNVLSILIKLVLQFSNLILLSASIFFVVFLVYFFQTQVYTTGQELGALSSEPKDALGGNAFGNDATSAYGYIVWMDKYFPSIPFWFPEQGAGVSFTSGYQWLAHYIVVAVHHFTNINLQMSFSLVRDASFLLSAIGIVLICFFRLDYPKQKPIRLVIGLIAVYFYLVSPITRYWTDKWGFFAEGVSYMFVAPALIFIDWFIDLSFNRDKSWKIRIALIFSAIFYALAFHTHFMTGLAITNIFTLLLLIKTLMRSLKTGWEAPKTALKVVALVAVSTFVLFGWRFFMFRDYGIQTAKGGSSVNLITVGPSNPKNIFKFEKLEGNFPTFKQILGIEVLEFPDQRFVFQGYFMPPYVWFFVLCGLVLSWIRSRKVFVFAILSAWGFFAYSPNESGIIGYAVQFITNTTGGAGAMFFGNRPAWAAARLLAPITAAYGIFMLIDVLLMLPDFLSKKIGKFINLPWKHILRPIIVIPAMIWIFISVIYSVDYQKKLLGKDIPQVSDFTKVYDPNQPTKVYIGNHKTDLTNVWQNTTKNSDIVQQLIPSNWPKKDLSQMPFGDFSLDKNLEIVPERPLYTRMDISGYSGSLVMTAPLLTEVSTTQAYVANLILFSGLQNFQTAVMYVDYPIYQKNNILSELAKWFGYEYVLAQTNSTIAKSLYDENPEWERTEIGEWYRFKNHKGLASWTTKPSVLFIGNQEKFLYDQFFKSASVGSLSYDDAIIFKGTNLVEDYSLEELKKFPLIVMSGYGYKDPNKAHSLLEKYVKDGGSLFIDTGWQYNNPDWEGKKLPPYFPTNKLEWKTLPLKSQFVLDQTEHIDYQVENKLLGETGIRGAQWGASAAQDVREESNVIVQSGGSPVLMTRNYGKGKVVWSGYNIVAYIEGNHNENQQQIDLLNKLFHWLLPKKSSEEPSDITITRHNPDQLQFDLNQSVSESSTLYWREAYHPKWNARLIDNQNKKTDLNVYTAGPRFMAIKLPPVEKGSKIELQIKMTFNEIFIIVISVISTFFLLSHTFGLPEKIFNRIARKFKTKLKAIQSKTPEVITEENREATEKIE